MSYIWPWPKGSKSSQEFGTHPGGVNPAGGHTGLDVPLKVGTPLRAPADAKVVWADWCRSTDGSDNPWLLTAGGGIAVVLDAGPGQPNFIQAHLSRTDLHVGQHVKKGQIIGYSGNTGTWTTGPHCHFEVMLDGYHLRSNTYGRSNPRVLDFSYWEDVQALTIQVASSTTPGGPHPGLRTVTNDVAMARVAPYSDAAPAPAFPEGIAKGSNLAVAGYVKGEDPYGTGDTAWYKTKSGFYVWANSAGNNITDLPYLGEVARPTPPPAVTPAPLGPVEPPKYDFELDFTEINGITVDKIPAHWDNYGTEFPARPAGAVCHWWNSLEHRPSLASVIGEFCHRSTSKSPHFIVTDDRIIQSVSLTHRAFHAGAGNDRVGIEIDPLAIERNPDGSYTARALRIQANVRGLLEALKGRFGYELSLSLHKDVPGAATACSDLVLADFALPAETAAVPPAECAVDEEAVLSRLTDWIKQFLERKDK